MKNMTIFQKLIALSVFVAVVLAGLGVFGLRTTANVNKDLKDISTNWLPSIKEAENLRAATAELRLHDYRYLSNYLANDKAETQKSIELRKGKIQELEEVSKKYEGLISSSEERQLYDIFQSKVETYVTEGNKLQKYDESQQAEALAYFRGDVRAKYDEVMTALDQLIVLNEKGASDSYDSSQAEYSSAFSIMLGVIAFSILLTAAMCYFVIRSISSGVNELTRVFNSLTALDLRARSTSAAKDEIGNILHQFNATAGVLTDVVRGTQEAASSVAAASHELSSGMENISNVTTQQEAMLTSIAAALEETSQSSQEVNSKAQRSGQTTLEVVEAINRVVGKVGELRSKANSISDVLSIIRDVSEQINLLSLNASIEAARAGDAGRGFAVVADEVKKLAGHTHKSTDDISNVVQDLQQSVNETSQALEAVTGSLEEVRNNSSSVVAAVGQQTIAVKDIATHIDEFRHQMVAITSNIKEAQTAAMSLSAAAEELNRQNSQFKV